MSNNTTNGTGLPPPTKQGHVGTPAEAAYNRMQQQSTSQAELIKRTSGGSKKKKGGALIVAQVQPMYKEVSGPGGTVTDTQKNMGSTSAQSQSNAEYDNQLNKGGGKRCKKGGNPDWLWGCYSGGKKRKTRTNKRKTRRYRKKTRRNKK